MAIVLLLKAAILLLVCYLFVNARILYTRLQCRHFRRIFYPISFLWFLGVVPDVKRRQKKGNTNIAKIFCDYHLETGWDLFVVHLFSRNIIVTLDLGMIGKILIDHRVFQKNADTNTLMSRVAGVRLFGNRGMLNEPGSDVWYSKRRVMEPAFHKSFLRRIVPELNNIADKLVEYLQPQVGTNEPFDITYALNRSALESIARCGFNWDEETIEENNHSSLLFASLAVDIMAKIFLERFTFNLPYKHRKLKKQFRAATLEARSKAKEILLRRLESNSENTNDILQHIIRANMSLDAVDIEDVIDDYIVFLGAGMETTAITMSLTVFYLSVYPDIYKKVMTELHDVCNGKDYITFEDTNKLVYLEMVIKECLRMKPPISATGRECVKNNVTVNHHFIPKGAYIFIPQSVLQKDTRYWNNPEVFNPDRFHPTEGDKVTAFTYMPFMVGPRSCIGKHFAILETKVVLSKLLKSYKLVNPNPSVKDLEVTGSITQRPIEGVSIILNSKTL